MKSNEMNWEEVRANAAIAAMQATISNEKLLDGTGIIAKKIGRNTRDLIIANSIDYANKLVEELKKGE